MAGSNKSSVNTDCWLKRPSNLVKILSNFWLVKVLLIKVKKAEKLKSKSQMRYSMQCCTVNNIVIQQSNRWQSLSSNGTKQLHPLTL